MPTPRPLLVDGRARMVGDPVALIVADTHAQALDALEAVQIDWEPLPAVASVAAATRTGAPSLRVVGDVSGGRLGRQGPFAKVLDYEREYERSVSSRFPVSTLCLYDPHRLSGLETAQLVAVHGDLFHEPVGAVVR